MLVFDPRERSTITAALGHPYLAVLHAQMEEPLCHATFGFEFERPSNFNSSTGPSGGGAAGASPAGFKGDVIIPRAELQAMMYGEMVELLTSPNFVRHASPPVRAAAASGGGSSAARADGKDDDSKMDD